MVFHDSIEKQTNNIPKKTDQVLVVKLQGFNCIQAYIIKLFRYVLVFLFEFKGPGNLFKPTIQISEPKSLKF